MSLASLVADVITLTKRPDLVTETETAVKAATLKAHQTDYYPKDIVEAAIQFDSSAYQQDIEYTALFPRWRSLKYLRKYNVALDAPGAFFDIISPEASLDAYGALKHDVAYLAGVIIKLRSRAAIEHALIGYYVHPDITVAGWNTWIEAEHPYAIIYEAARVIFKTIGYDEQTAQYEKLVGEQYTLLRQSQIQAVGY